MLYDAMEKLQELLLTVQLTQGQADALTGGERNVRRVYMVAPDRSKPLPDFPCFVLEPDAGEDMGAFGAASEHENNYTIQIDFYASKNNDEEATKIALAFLDSAWTALVAERPYGRRLGGSVDFLQVRAERPMIETLVWAEKSHPGFHLFLDVQIFARVEVA